jgi:hypothetical protein
MAVLYDGIDRMLADMQWSTKSTYQIQSTFYIISQPSTEDLLAQTVAWQDGAGPSVDMRRDGKCRFAATRPSGRVLWKRENRCRIEPSMLIRGPDES